MPKVLLTNDGRGRENSWEASIHVECFEDGIATAHVYADGKSETEARARLNVAIEKLRERLLGEEE